MPPLQRLTRKVLGFPMPFWPVGIWGFLPIPRPVKMRVCFGQPIKMEIASEGEPTEEEVDQLHYKFYKAMQDLYDKHKEVCGYSGWELVMIGKPKHWDF